MYRVWHQMKDTFDAKTKQWSYVWRMSSVQILHITAKEVTIESKYGFGNRLYKVGPTCILMQSIGLNDKNNKPIFIGDIVNVKDKINETSFTGIIKEDNVTRYIETNKRMYMNWPDYELEVIGNIHEHSEKASQIQE